MPVIVRATYALSTPLFSAGTLSDQPELRLSAFKGNVRYWWRVLAWSRFRGDLTRIHEEEAKTFGSPGREGQSRVIMRLVSQSRAQVLHRGEFLVRNLRSTGAVGPPVGVYYLGYGLVNAGGRHAGRVTRAALAPPLSFTVEMLVAREKLSDAAFETLIDALKAIGMLGGMGARSRRGYGSLVLNRLTLASRLGAKDTMELWHPPKSPDELRREVARFNPDGAPRALPPYTALSRFSRCVIVEGGTNDALKLLDSIGRELMLYRGWGLHGKVAGWPSERRFEYDYLLMRDLKEPVTTHPRRIVFGLPHNYHFSSLEERETGQSHGPGGRRNDVGRKPDQRANRSVRPVGPKGYKVDRRASPLFIHIHMCGTTPVGVLTLLPATFLPDGSQILIRGPKDHYVELEKDEAKLYEPVEGFLDRLLRRSGDPKNTPKMNIGYAAEVRWA